MDLLNRRITFGGEVIPAYIGSAPTIIRATRKITTTPVPGSNREIITMEDAWEPYDQPYELFVGDGTPDNIQDKIKQVAERLYKTGWQVLLDDYEPGIFRLAYYKGPFDVENRFTRLGKFTVTFRCRAERFLLQGNNPVAVASGKTLTNPTRYNARPLIHIEGSGNGTITVGSQTVTITGMTDYLNLDSETQNCYRLASENKNDLMEGAFPVIPPGNSTVTFTGGITAATITPRYWTI